MNRIRSRFVQFSSMALVLSVPLVLVAVKVALPAATSARILEGVARW